jgi:hypothetical protein
MQNLNYWTQGKNDIKANTLYNGMGSAVQDGEVFSVFNNTYPDRNPTIRIPLKELYPSSIGASDMFPADESLSMVYFLEPFYRLFQSLSKSSYVAPVQAAAIANPANLAFTSDGEDQSVLTPAATGQLVGYAVGQYVALIVGDNAAAVYKITTVTPDAGQTIGSLTVDSLVTAGAVTVSKVYPAAIVTAGTVACNNVVGQDVPVSSITATTAGQAPAVGTTIQVSYFEYTPGMVLTDFTTLQSSSYVKVSTSAGGVVTTSDPIFTSNLPDGSNLYGVTIDVLTGTNLDNYDWKILDSHLVIYRRNVPMVRNKNMLVSNFESMNVQMAGGVDKFFYTFLVDKSCYNAYALVPTGDNLYSQQQNISQYQYSVDGKPLTSIYLPSLSSLHNDNLMRVLNNSPYYPPKNLNQDRDDEEAPNPTDINPIMYPAKVYPSMRKGEPVVNEDIGRTNLKLELKSAATTPAANVYLFCEKYQEL